MPGAVNMDNSLLKMRLRSCLQTILELEPCLAQIDAGPQMHKEFEALKRFLQDLDQLNLTEADVLRVESSTNIFLEELSLPMRAGACADASFSKLQ